MVSVEKITDKLGRLDEFLSILQGMHRISLDAFVKDKILIGSAKYYLQVSIECCLDIANHIISAERFRAPSDYADSFKVLEEQGIVPAEFGLKLRQMAKFRNRLVHLYGEIDMNLSGRICRTLYPSRKLLQINISRAPCDVCRESFSKPQTRNVSILKIL